MKTLDLLFEFLNTSIPLCYGDFSLSDNLFLLLNSLLSLTHVSLKSLDLHFEDFDLRFMRGTDFLEFLTGTILFLLLSLFNRLSDCLLQLSFPLLNECCFVSLKLSLEGVFRVQLGLKEFVILFIMLLDVSSELSRMSLF